MSTYFQLAEANSELAPPIGNLSIAVILPTYNERENIPALIDRLSTALAGLDWELVFVDDDSPDGTSDLVRTYAGQDKRIRLIQRVGRRGLSTACIEGLSLIHI